MELLNSKKIKNINLDSKIETYDLSKDEEVTKKQSNKNKNLIDK